MLVSKHFLHRTYTPQLPVPFTHKVSNPSSLRTINLTGFSRANVNSKPTTTWLIITANPVFYTTYSCNHITQKWKELNTHVFMHTQHFGIIPAPEQMTSSSSVSVWSGWDVTVVGGTTLLGVHNVNGFPWYSCNNQKETDKCNWK